MSEPQEPGTEHTQVGHWMRDDCDVYAGRGRNGARFGSVEIGERGWLGNPYRADEYGREECIEKFRTVFERCLSDDEESREAIRDLAGKRLGCWCQRLDEDEPACHAEVIAEHADRLASIRADGGPEQTGSEHDDGSIFDSDGKAWHASKRELEQMVAGHYDVDGLWLKDDSLVYFDGDEEHLVSDDVGLYGHGPSGAVCVREDELPSQGRVETVVGQAGDRDE